MASNNQIRILSLHPSGGNADASIRCDLNSVTLSDKPKYEALSYVWGDAGSLLQIEMSGASVHITKSLHSALKRLRLPDAVRTLWIDQLCIHQWDKNDKARQVRLMRHIYSQCQDCLVWLGEIPDDLSESDVGTAFEMLKGLALYDRTGVEYFITKEQLESFLRMLHPLSTNHWWKRLWTLQETVLSPNTTVVWGPRSISWTDLNVIQLSDWGEANNAVMRKTVVFDSWDSVHLDTARVDLDNLVIAKEGDDSPATLVRRWRYREATDPRDKIYGLLGLIPSGSLPSTEMCDYDKSARDVFCEATYELIAHERSPNALITDPRVEPTIATPDMPRWAIDAAGLPLHATGWRDLYIVSCFNAHGGRPLNLDMLKKGWASTHISLSLEGMYVDTVMHVGEPWLDPRPAEARFPESYNNLFETVWDWQRLAEENGKSGSAWLAQLKENFTRMLFSDLTVDPETEIMRSLSPEEARGLEGKLDSIRGLKSLRDHFFNLKAVDDMMNLQHYLKDHLKNHRFFITRSGLIGLGHIDTVPGDEVWILAGGSLPFTIKRREGGNTVDYDFGGACFVQEIMFGEAINSDSKFGKIVIY